MNNDLRVTVIVKNGRMLSAMERAGFHTASALSRATGVQQTTIGHYLALRLPPYLGDGRLRNSIVAIAGALKSIPEDLFPAPFLVRALAKNKVTRSVSVDDLPALTGDGADAPAYNPERSAIVHEAVSELTSALNDLLPRERQCIAMFYGLDGYRSATLDTIAKEMGVTRERVRQIILKGERRLRHPGRNLRERCAGLLEAAQ